MKINSYIQDITTASEGEADGISQLSQGLDRISSVVQRNSATSEESAAASEELSGQAKVLNDLVARFHLKAEESSSQPSRGEEPKAPNSPAVEKKEEPKEAKAPIAEKKEEQKAPKEPVTKKKEEQKAPKAPAVEKKEETAEALIDISGMDGMDLSQIPIPGDEEKPVKKVKLERESARVQNTKQSKSTSKYTGKGYDSSFLGFDNDKY